MMKNQAELQWWQAGATGTEASAAASGQAQHRPEEDEQGLLTAGSEQSLLLSPPMGGQVPFWALMFFTFIMLLAPQAYYPVLAPLRIAFVTAVFAALSHLVSRLSHGQPIVQLNPGTVAVGALTFWCIFTLPVSFWPGGSMSFLLEAYFKTLIIFVLLANVINTLPKLYSICWGLTLMSIPLSYTTLKNFASGVFYEGGDRVLGTQGALTENPNDMALMLNLILPIAIALLLSVQKKWIKMLMLGVIGMMIGAIILTFSRAGFLTLAVTFACYLWLLRNRPQRMLIPIALVLSLAAVPFIPAGYSDRLNTITEIEQDESGSAQVRLADMILATEVFIRNPFIGAGVGMDLLALSEVRGSVGTHVHNVYLQYAVDLGLPGLLLFLFLFRTCLRNTRAVVEGNAGRRQYNTLFYLAEGIRVSLIAFAVAAFFYPVAYHFYFYYIAGLAIALPTVSRSEELDGSSADTEEDPAERDDTRGLKREWVP